MKNALSVLVASFALVSCVIPGRTGLNIHDTLRVQGTLRAHELVFDSPMVRGTGLAYQPRKHTRGDLVDLHLQGSGACRDISRNMPNLATLPSFNLLADDYTALNGFHYGAPRHLQVSDPSARNRVVVASDHRIKSTSGFGFVTTFFDNQYSLGNWNDVRASRNFEIRPNPKDWEKLLARFSRLLGGAVRELGHGGRIHTVRPTPTTTCGLGQTARFHFDPARGTSGEFVISIPEICHAVEYYCH